MEDAPSPSDLIVFHRDGARARRTIERLSRAGVDGSAISLLGPVEVVTAGRYGDRQTDRGSASALAGLVLRGGFLGAMPGAVFGAVLLAVFAVPTAVNIASGALGGAMFGAGVGVLAGLLHAPTMVSAWERTFAPLLPGGVAVGVVIASPRIRQRVDRALRGADVERIVEVDDLEDLPDGLLTRGDRGDAHGG